MSQFDHRLMVEAFRMFEAHEQMRGVQCTYGARSEQQLAATPRVRWEPSRDTFSGPVSRRSIEVQPRGQNQTNQLSSVASRYVRDAGADLVLYGRTDEDVESLIARVVLALEDVLVSANNGHPVSGQWDPARSHSTGCDRYVLSIVMKLPVVRVLPAATVQTTTLTEKAPAP